MPTKSTNWKDWCWCVVMGLLIPLIVSLLYIYWPAIMYAFNLYHSKTLPYISENFVGREEDMKEVTGLVDFKKSDFRIVNIIGPPGFGKSTLAIHIGHEIVKKGVIVLYLDVGDFSDKAIKPALAAKVLDSSNTVVSKEVKFERLLKWTRNRFWYTLLILDNCDDVLNNQRDEFQDAIVKVVEESLNVKVLITSRMVATFTKYYKWHQVRELSITAACELLDNKVPTTVNLMDSEKEQIANLTGSVPLALQIIGSLLQLPASPSPSVIIQQLEKELILTLSSEEFPPHEQVYASISISYGYLSLDLQTASHHLTIFPGSLDLRAVLAIFSSKTIVLKKPHLLAENGAKFLAYLARNSLLEHNQCNDRYRYHILIKEYLLPIQRKFWSRDATSIHVPAFYIYYAQELMLASKVSVESSMAIIDLDLHNIQKLLDDMPKYMRLLGSSWQMEEFLKSSAALVDALDAGLIKMRFSRTNLYDLLRRIVDHFDRIDSYKTLKNLQKQTGFPVRTIVYIYLELISHLAASVGELSGLQAAAEVYRLHKRRIESLVKLTGLDEFIKFCLKASDYLHKLGLQREVVEWHRMMQQKMGADLANCQRNRCKYGDIAQTYSAMGLYKEAAKFFKLSLETSSDAMSKAAALIKLKSCYDKLKEGYNITEVVDRLNELFPDLMSSMSSDIIIDGDLIQTLIIDLYREVGYTKEADQLEMEFINTLEIVESADLIFSKELDILMGMKILHHLDKSGNYIKVVQLGTPFMNAITQTLNISDNNWLTVEVSLLIGKAKISGGNFSDGMNDTELVLQKILQHPNLYDQRQRDIACSLLIPRLVYIETCYHISGSVLNITEHTVLSLASLLLSSFPFTPAIGSNETVKLPPQTTYSHSTKLATVSGPLKVFWQHQQQQLIQLATEIIRKTYYSLTAILPIAKLKRLINIFLCILVIWAKLMLYYILYAYRHRKKTLCILVYRLLLEYSLFVLRIIPLLLFTQDFSLVWIMIHKMRDPRRQHALC